MSIGWSHQKGWTGKPLFLTAPAQSSWIGRLTIRSGVVRPHSGRLTSNQLPSAHPPSVGTSKTHPCSVQAFCLIFTMRREFGTPPDVSYSTKINSTSHFNTVAQPARSPYRTSCTSWVLHFQPTAHKRLKPSTHVPSSGYSSWPGYQRHCMISANPST
jgi:hypothetical protein